MMRKAPIDLREGVKGQLLDDLVQHALACYRLGLLSAQTATDEERTRLMRGFEEAAARFLGREDVRAGIPTLARLSGAEQRLALVDTASLVLMEDSQELSLIAV